MAKRKTATRGDDPLVELKRRRCCLSNASAEETRVDVDQVHTIHEDSGEGNETITCDLNDGFRREKEMSTLPETEQTPPPPPPPPVTQPPPVTPPAAELESFFADAEKKQQQYFTEKYNFDFEKEVPLEGRYEWVLVKP